MDSADIFHGLSRLRWRRPAVANPPFGVWSMLRTAPRRAKRRQAGLAIAIINRQLEVLRRMLQVAVERGKVGKLLPKVEMLSGARKISTLPQPPRRVTTILLDCALRPEECFRMRWRTSEMAHCTSSTARRTTFAARSIPMTQRVAAQLDMRQTDAESEWVFPAPRRPPRATSRSPR